MRLPLHLLLLLSGWIAGSLANIQEDAVREFFAQDETLGPPTTSTHTNNWAVLVCASRYWFNYRHMANALGMYRTVKRLGIPDSNIILMLGDDAACNTRNKFPGSVYAEKGCKLDLYGDKVEVDYRGYEVTVENFIRLLTGRVDPSVPRSKRLLTDDRSNIFIYMTGHGGNEFLKFQDTEEISAFDIADAFAQMHEKRRYNEIFFMIDTCQANTMYSKFYSPNVLATGSSLLDENSYSHENDPDLGIAVIDSYTHYVLEYLEGINKTSPLTMQNLFDHYDVEKIRSHPGVRSDLFKRPVESALITDFFGGVAQVEVMQNVADVAADIALTDDALAQEKVVSQLTRAPRIDAVVPRNMSIEQHAEVSSWGGTWRTCRSWVGLGLVGGLVGWVCTR
ncbi:peptidase C13 family-domain-containing protein [Schizophyllum commune]